MRMRDGVRFALVVWPLPLSWSPCVWTRRASRVERYWDFVRFASIRSPRYAIDAADWPRFLKMFGCATCRRRHELSRRSKSTRPCEKHTSNDGAVTDLIWNAIRKAVCRFNNIVEFTTVSQKRLTYDRSHVPRYTVVMLNSSQRFAVRDDHHRIYHNCFDCSRFMINFKSLCRIVSSSRTPRVSARPRHRMIRTHTFSRQ